MSETTCHPWCGQSGEKCGDTMHACYSPYGSPCACTPECADANDKKRAVAPPSDHDVRGALVGVIRAADRAAFSQDIADAILADPLLGKLLRGGR